MPPSHHLLSLREIRNLETCDFESARKIFYQYCGFFMEDFHEAPIGLHGLTLRMDA
jgi:hypothetical protein